MTDLTVEELQKLVDEMAETCGKMLGDFILDNMSKGLSPEDSIDVIGVILGAVLADFGVEDSKKAGMIMAESVEDGFKQAKLMDLMDPK